MREFLLFTLSVETVETPEFWDLTNWPLEFTICGLDVRRKATLRSATSERRESDHQKNPHERRALLCAARLPSFLHTGWTVCSNGR